MGLVAIVLAAGYGTRLARDIAAANAEEEDGAEEGIDRAGRGRWAALVGCPKPLLPIDADETPLLTRWMQSFQDCNARRVEACRIDAVVVVTNHAFREPMAQWAQRNGVPADCVVDDGSTTNEGRKGAIADLALALQSKEELARSKDVLVVAGDTLFRHDFHLATFLQQRQTDADHVLFYRLENDAEVAKRGIVEVGADGVLTRFLEKPTPQETESRLACPAFYVLRNSSIPLVFEFLDSVRGKPVEFQDAPGQLVAWLLTKTTVRGTRISGRFDIGNLKDYEKTLSEVGSIERAHARIGFMGNPSDGFYGKTISLTIEEFYAEVRIWESPAMTIYPNERYDRASFSNMEDLVKSTKLFGYYGGVRLLRATMARFFQLCDHANLTHIVQKKNFSLTYESNIPFAVGLAGSSAIVTACFRALLKFYGLSHATLGLTMEQVPNVILAVEKEELGIAAGLQDRVIQTYEGLVFMDFSEAIMQHDGHGAYTRMDPTCLPVCYLAYLVEAGGDSGKVHNDVRKRWESGDAFVRDGMRKFAQFASDAKAALESGDYAAIGRLLEAAFALRREIYSDRVVGERNIAMVEFAKRNGFAAAFTGSGGAILMIYTAAAGAASERENPTELSDAEERRMETAFAEEGYHFLRVHCKTPTRSRLSL